MTFANHAKSYADEIKGQHNQVLAEINAVDQEPGDTKTEEESQQAAHNPGSNS